MKNLVLGFLTGLLCSIVFFTLSKKVSGNNEVVAEAKKTYSASKSNRNAVKQDRSESSAVIEPSNVNDHISFKDNFKLAASVQEMSVKQIEEYLQSPDFSETYFHGRLKTDFIESLFTRYADLDPDGAMDFLKESKNPVRTQAAFPLFYQWALNDPSTAKNALDSLKDTPLHRTAVNAVIAGASRIDPERGLDISAEHADGRFDGVALWYMAEDDPQKALEHSSLQEKSGRHTKGRILSRWLVENPSEAQGWLAENSQEMSDREVSHLKRRFQQHDPDLVNQLSEILPEVDSIQRE